MDYLSIPCSLGQVVRSVFTGTFESMRGHGYIKELDSGRFLARISITDPGKRCQPSKTIRGTKKDAELALARLQIEHLGGTAISTGTTFDVLIDQFLSAPSRSESPRGPESRYRELCRYQRASGSRKTIAPTARQYFEKRARLHGNLPRRSSVG